MTDTPVTSPLDHLGAALAQPLEDATGRWRWAVRRHLSGVRDLLVARPEEAPEGWAAARRTSAARERTALLTRLGSLGPQVLEEPDLDGVRRDLARFLSDVRHHLQRRNDLVWDEVELDLGGSE